MKCLVIGGDGRAHALTWRLAQSPSVNHVFVAPGNAGTATLNAQPLTPPTAEVSNVPIQPTDIEALLAFANEQAIDLTVIGPEAPLALGVVDRFEAAGRYCFGPTQAAAQLETSKTFAKALMQTHGIPTARYASFNDLDRALAYVATQSFPLVIKADGLAAGKGVVIAEQLSQAQDALQAMLGDHQFGEASHRVVIEDYLDGQELSYMVLVDGMDVLPLASSQDHKRRDDGDQGPNTGGMGAYSPAPLLTPALEKKVLDTVIHPTLRALAQQGIRYRGFLYAGLMIDSTGQPSVLEFNCRLGDPETQPLMMRLQSDLAQALMAAKTQQLKSVSLRWTPQFAVAVVMAAGGYPGPYEKGDVITGLDAASDRSDCQIFHAGTQFNGKNHVVTAGGRVLAVTALGDTLEAAKTQAYHVAAHIQWPHCFYRKDIGDKGIAWIAHQPSHLSS